MTNPFTIAGAPAALQARIDARRATIPAGMTMTAAPPEGGEEQTQTPAPPETTAPPAGGDELTAARAEIERLRRENGEKRVKARDADKEAQTKISGALKALQEAGLLPDSIKLDDADPVKVAEAAAEEARVAAEATRTRLVLSESELVVWRASRELGLNAEAITDSRSFGDAVKGLDPDAADFGDKVRKAAQDAASKNPLLRSASTPVGKGGSSFAGGSGERRDASKAAPGAQRLEAAYGATGR